MCRARVVGAADAAFPSVRTPPARRKFKSEAVEQVIRRVKSTIGNKELAWMFENCFPNTLDTTIDFGVMGGRPDTYVITGDIDAMWLRDSTAQVWPYLPLMKDDPALGQLIAGVINRQTRCILKDPYANAFYKDETKISGWKDDRTEMKPGVHQRKWEIDSLCFPIRLAYHYWKTSGDAGPFDAAWHRRSGSRSRPSASSSGRPAAGRIASSGGPKRLPTPCRARVTGGRSARSG